LTKLALFVGVLLLSGSTSPSQLGVRATEFHLVLSRPSVKAGRVAIELENAGEDVHDLRLRRVGGWRTYGIRATKPGGRGELETRLRAGTYRLWCSIADHRTRGMRATLRVR
jgi:hypothetical protein